MEEKVFNFAIIGCGVIAPNHAEGIVNTPNARLVAVADIVEEKAKVLPRSTTVTGMWIIRRCSIDLI